MLNFARNPVILPRATDLCPNAEQDQNRKEPGVFCHIWKFSTLNVRFLKFSNSPS